MSAHMPQHAPESSVQQDVEGQQQMSSGEQQALQQLLHL